MEGRRPKGASPCWTHVWPERASGYLDTVDDSDQAAPSKCLAAFIGQPRDTNADGQPTYGGGWQSSGLPS